MTAGGTQCRLLSFMIPRICANLREVLQSSAYSRRFVDQDAKLPDSNKARIDWLKPLTFT